MILETERLKIEEASIDDRSFFFQLLNSPNWIEYIGDRGISNEEDALAYIENSLIHSYTTFGFGLYKMVLKESHQPIGICGFLKRDYLDHPDIGFAILPAFERKGYTLEASMTMMDYGTNSLGLARILAITTPKNKASQGLLKKIGLSHIGEVKPDDDKEELMLFSSGNN